jgi:hypothetical protein
MVRKVLDPIDAILKKATRAKEEAMYPKKVLGCL